MTDLTIVMYHYVRPIQDSKFPGIKGLELTGFERQLDFFQENYNIVETEQVIEAVTLGKKLPKNAIWLTFDDGYKDHYGYVLPSLLRRKLTGAFFPPKLAIEENVILDVNSVHHILSCAQDINELVCKLGKLCSFYGISTEKFNECYQQFAVSNRYDSKDTIFFKRMLQHALPEDVRSLIAAELFYEYVGETEADFSNKLYMSLDEVRSLVDNGMYVGSHGCKHYWLDKISIEAQRQDIGDSLEFLEHIGASTSKWVMCYPYGAYNQETLSLLHELGASVGVTTEVRTARLSEDNPLTLPRFDTNDFPQ